MPTPLKEREELCKLAPMGAWQKHESNWK
jgi:hypothetical protein